MFRIARHLGARSVPADDHRVLAAFPVFSNESVTGIRGTVTAMTTARSFADQPSEVNWYGVYVPWPVFMTYLKDSDGDAQKPWPDSAAKLDRRIRDLLFEAGEDGNEYYGGDGIQGANDDLTHAISESSSGEAELAGGFMGPTGVHRWFSRETFLRPWGADGDNQTRFWDDFEFSVPLSGGPGLYTFSCLRYEHAAETNFNIEGSGGSELSALNLLTGGDLSRINYRLKYDTSGLSDHMRTMLFGGDNFIEADTLKGESVKCYIKAALTVQTPYDLTL